jgi:cell division protein FtsI (penicillin-binding protein 3)
MRTTVTPGLDARQIKWVRFRVWMLSFLFVPLFLVMVGRAFSLQLVQGQQLGELAQEQYLSETEIPPRRGVIYDRNGSPLAASVDVDSISVDPSLLPEDSKLHVQLARTLGLDPRELEKRLARSKHFAWLKRGATPAEVTAVKALGTTGLTFVKEPRRFYPQRELAANVLGFAGVDGEGLEGIELAYNDQLKGRGQSVDLIKDAQKRAAFAEGVSNPDELSGAAVTLTLDRSIQHIAEVAVQHAAQKTQCNSAMAVVLDPKTGELLAMASTPTFNPNDPAKSDPAHQRNHPVVDSFEPGSTFKAFSMSAALEEHVVKPTDSIFCENGRYAIGNRFIRDDEVLGWITASKVIQVSSNIGAAKIAKKLGRDKLNAYYKLFGFGEKTGIGLPGEVRGQVPFPRAEITFANQAFGQGLTANAIQLAAAYGAIANGGTLMKPFLVRKVVDPDGTVLESHGPEPVRQVISAKTSQMITEMLKTVVQKGGTGTKAAMDDYVVAGKTGTAQKADPETGRYSTDRRTGSFIGFVPADDPRLVIAVIIDEPQGDKYGGLVAAPAFKEIAEQALPLLGVPPTHRNPLVATSNAAAGTGPNAAVASADSKSERASDKAAAEDDVVDSEDAPSVGAGKAVVPDLTGLGARDVVHALAQAELEVDFSGSGRAIRQSPSAGTVVPRGSHVVVKLESRL